MSLLDLTGVEKAELLLSTKYARNLMSEEGSLKDLITTAEIKTVICSWSAIPDSTFTRTERNVGEWTSAFKKEVIYSDHLCRLLHQCHVLKVDIALFAWASLSGLLYMALVYVSCALMEHVLDIITLIAVHFLSCISTKQCPVPPFVRCEVTNMIRFRLPIWKFISTDFLQNGSISALRLFRHGLLFCFPGEGGRGWEHTGQKLLTVSIWTSTLGAEFHHTNFQDSPHQLYFVVDVHSVEQM